MMGLCFVEVLNVEEEVGLEVVFDRCLRLRTVRQEVCVGEAEGLFEGLWHWVGVAVMSRDPVDGCLRPVSFGFGSVVLSRQVGFEETQLGVSAGSSHLGDDC